MLALALAGCATQGGLPNAGGPAAVSEPQVAQLPPMSPAHAREHRRILATYGGVYSNEGLERYLHGVVGRLVATSDMPNQRYQVTVLNSPTINAFALPNGQLYITRGLVALANDTAELASVVAHEMAHVTARHAAMREGQVRQAALVSRVANDLLSDPGLGALALARSKIALASFSRSQEVEADSIGIGVAARAGFDPYGAQRFLTAMGANAALRSREAGLDPGSPDFLSSHPATPERISNAIMQARQYTGPGAGLRDRDAYLNVIDGLIYGEDPSDGFVRGRRFTHPKLGFTFTAPAGFELENVASAVFGVKDGGAQAMRLDVARVPPDQALDDYLRSGWIQNVDTASVRALTLNGLPAATATAQGEGWTFRLYAIRFGEDVYRFIFAARQKSDAIDRSFAGSVETFRRITPAEAQAARPERLRIVTVRPGDTVERLARRMGPGPRPLERFRVLNGLDAGDKVSPGDRVKIVME